MENLMLDILDEVLDTERRGIYHRKKRWQACRIL